MSSKMLRTLNQSVARQQMRVSTDLFKVRGGDNSHRRPGRRIDDARDQDVRAEIDSSRQFPNASQRLSRTVSGSERRYNATPARTLKDTQPNLITRAIQGGSEVEGD